MTLDDALAEYLLVFGADTLLKNPWLPGEADFLRGFGDEQWARKEFPKGYVPRYHEIHTLLWRRFKELNPDPK